MHANLPSESSVRSAGSHSGGRLLLLSAIVAALGSLLFGFDTAVISGTTEALRQAFALNDNLLGFTVSSTLIGTMFGALGAGRPADWWGRRPVLTVLAVLFLVSAAGCAGAWNWHVLLGFRFLGGVAVGAASVVCPMYITEIAPPKRRGLLVCVSQLNIVLGILVAYLSNYLVARFLGADNPVAWRWMFGVMVLPSLAFLVAALVIPESPRWLVKKGRLPEAETVLARFGHADPAQENREIQESLSAENTGASDRLFQRRYLKPLLLVCMIINELLPNAVRASGSAVACTLMWVLCAAIDWDFPVVAKASGALVFEFFALMMVFQFILVAKFLPETKGVSLEELQKRL